MPDKNVSAYLLNDGDEWFIHLTGWYEDSTLHVDGEPAKIAPGTVGNTYTRWWVTDHKPERMEMVGKPTKQVVAYRLPEGTQIEGLPRELTRDEWRERFWNDREYEVDDARGNLYDAIQEDVPAKIEVLDVPVLVLEGQPDYLRNWSWSGSLPNELRYRSEYLHLFPGCLTDFPAAVQKHLEAITDFEVKFYTHSSKYSLFVKAHDSRAGYLYTSDHYPVPYRIDGPNKAAAVELWKAKLAEIEADIRAKCEVCAHCNGTGLPPHKLIEKQPQRGGCRRRTRA